jgi:polyhydroxybutyrate depolymerase
LSARRLRSRLLLSLVPLLVALAGCGGSGGGADASQPATSPTAPTIRPQVLTPTPARTTAPTTAPASASAAVGGVRCPEPAPGTTVRTVSVAGVSRSYLLAIPPQGGPRPVVIDFHGYQQSARQQDAYTGLSAAGVRTGFVVLTPDGYQGQWNFVRRAAVGPDDVAFVEAMLSDAATRACLDSRRIGATGMSDGADMADTLVCALPGRISAVVPVAPSVFPLTGCASPVNYLEIHGTADPIVPYVGGGGDRPPPFQGTQAQPVAARFLRWAQLAGCGTSAPHALVAGVTVTKASCPAGRDVQLVTVNGGGHTWPSAVGPPPAAGLGPTTTAVNADVLVLQFVAAHHS